MTRKSRRSAAPGLQYARIAIRISTSLGTPRYFLQGHQTGQSLTDGIPMIKSGQWCLLQRLQPQWLSQGYCASFSANVADPPGFSAACRRRAATRDDRIVTSIAVLRGKGLEVDGSSKHANRLPGRLPLLGMSIGTSKAQLSPPSADLLAQ
jgi:hypothetical protein